MTQPPNAFPNPPPTAPGIFFDGRSAARHAVRAEASPAALLIRRAEDGVTLATWRYDQLEERSLTSGTLRLAHAGDAGLQRLEISDPQFVAFVDELSLPVDRSGGTARSSRRKVVAWSMVAMLSLLGVGVFGVPAIATRLAPLVPFALERRIGEAVEGQVRAMLDPGQQGRNFECGWEPQEKPGRAALDHMLARLQQAAGLPQPLRLIVVRRPDANAMALPGGHIFVFQGLIDKAENADEVAGVIAHEIGHVAHRDGMRSVLSAGGFSLLFGFVLGDFVGGGAVIIAAKAMLQLAYSREVEADADRYAIGLRGRRPGRARGGRAGRRTLSLSAGRGRGCWCFPSSSKQGLEVLSNVRWRQRASRTRHLVRLTHRRPTLRGQKSACVDGAV